MADFNKEKFIEKTRETAGKAAEVTRTAAGKTAVFAKAAAEKTAVYGKVAAEKTAVFTKAAAEKTAVYGKAAAVKSSEFAKNVVWEVKAAPDRTFEFSKQDIAQNKLVSMLSYVPFAVLVPLFWSKITGKHSPYMQFHAKQGLILFVIELITALVLGLFARIPIIGFIFSLAKALVFIACAVLAAKNIWDILNDKAVKLPYIDRINWLKMFMK